MTKQYDAAKIEAAIADAKAMIETAKISKDEARGYGDTRSADYYIGQIRGIYNLLAQIQNCEVKCDGL